MARERRVRVNQLSFHVLFQCKRWKGSVGAASCATFAVRWRAGEDGVRVKMVEEVTVDEVTFAGF
ncbi:hypothetical protein DBIPINDM_003455 [Mesorhizobium sp. AR02]|uniref:hypothetical protein n=1 Tax=Mesorhizobium sp. AR02 TaxID=2865837 RepID=UPI00215E38C2|nr:hypothetical protein [Mesorhizobium sp. AR02]UVK56823.1 hypothetical protein DBIPINDM_003455 [Mesorhizobium sp. AR02]